MTRKIVSLCLLWIVIHFQTTEDLVRHMNTLTEAQVKTSKIIVVSRGNIGAYGWGEYDLIYDEDAK